MPTLLMIFGIRFYFYLDEHLPIHVYVACSYGEDKEFRYIGINKSLMARYIYGISKPSEQRIQQIKDALRTIGQQLQAV